jgi:hypothetical protein
MIFAYQNIDLAFKDHFEKKDVVHHKYDFAYKLKNKWVEERLLSLKHNTDLPKLNNFLKSLPREYQIDKTENFINYIAILRSKFLYLLLEEKTYDEDFFHMTAKSRHFYDYDQSSDNYLKDDVKTALINLSLKKIINKAFMQEEEYLDSTFLIGCFNLYLQFFFSPDFSHYDGQHDRYLDGYMRVSKRVISDTKEFFFDSFLNGISETVKLEMHGLITEYFDNHHTKINLNLGFKNLLEYAELIETNNSADSFKQIEENVPWLNDPYSNYLSWYEMGRGSYDVHSLWDSRESKSLGNAVLIDNMVGASKVLGMYSDFISEDQQDYLRYQKPYNGETTLIKLTESVWERLPEKLEETKWFLKSDD